MTILYLGEPMPRPNPEPPAEALVEPVTPSNDQPPSMGMSMRFLVELDEIGDLGYWKSCKGLGVKFANTAVPAAGNYQYKHLLPDRIDYPAITLQRAMTPSDSSKLQQFLRKVADEWYSGWSDYSGRTAVITLLDSGNNEVAKWALRNVYPSEWRGPDLDASGNGPALETLVFVHEGFL